MESGFGDVTGASALTSHTSWTSRSPTEKKLETSDEHGVGRSQCQRSPPGNNCMHIRGIRLSGLRATSDACAWLFCCVSALFLIFFYIWPGEWKGAERSWQPVFYSLPELSHRLPAGQFWAEYAPTCLAHAARLLTQWKQISHRSVTSRAVPVSSACAPSW